MNFFSWLVCRDGVKILAFGVIVAVAAMLTYAVLS